MLPLAGVAIIFRTVITLALAADRLRCSFRVFGFGRVRVVGMAKIYK
jgi:hypothetical protein